MAASHHHQQSHHMNNIHRSSSKTANTACVMNEEEEDDLAALRIAALKTLEERKVRKEPRALIVQRNNVLVIEPQDNVNDFRRSPVARRFSRERSLSPVIYRRRSREASPNLRKSSPPLSRWSPRSNAHRRSPSPYHVNGGHHSPSHLSWNPNKRRSSPRAHSPRRMSHSPRRRSPGRRRSSPPCRRSPHRLCSPSRRSPRKSPQRSPLRRSPMSRSSPTRRSPRKSPARNSPRRFSPRRRLRDSSSSRQGKSTRRNGEKRRVSPPVPSSGSSSSVSGRRRTTSPRNKEPTAHSPDLKQAKDDVPLPSTKKGRFERFEDSVASDDDSCNESLLDELFRETEETTAKTEALEAEPLDEDSQEKASADEGAVDGKMEDEDCLLLQADDDLDDLLVECTVPETAAVSPDPPCGHPGSEESRRGDPKKVGKQRDHDEKSRRRGRHNDHRRESSTEPAPRERHARSERPARIDKKENRERKSKVPKEDHKTGVNAEKRKRSRSRDRDKSKRKPSHKTSLKPERQTSDSKLERPQSHHSKSRNHDSTEMDISVEDRERLEARKKKFLQKELKPSQKVISLKKSPTNKTAETDDVRRVQDRLGEPVKEPKRSPRSDDTPQTHSKSTILSRLGPPPASRANIKDRIGHINTNSSSPTRTPQAGMDAAQVKFEVRNRPTLDPKLKIHINLGGTLSTGSSSGSSKSKKVVCLE